MAEIKNLTDMNFSDEISKGVTLVDFHADWCGPCRTIAPIIEQLADEMEDKISVAKVDVDHEQQTAIQYEINSIPTVILFKDGTEVDRVVGVRDKDHFLEMLGKALN